MLGHGMRADAYGTVMYHGIPEGVSGGVGLFIVANRAQTFPSKHFGNLRVGVHAGEHILALRQRVEDGVVFEAVGHHMVALLAGTRVQFGERFAHAAEFAHQNPVEGLVVQRLGDTAPPIGQIKHDGTCQLRSLFIDRSKIGPCIQQTGERFVNVVHGHPCVVHREILRFNIACGKAPEHGARIRHTTHIPAHHSIAGKRLLAFMP